MNNLNQARTKLTIYTSWGSYLFVILFPAFLFFLDYLSSLISGTIFSNNFGAAAVGIFTILVIFSVRMIKVSDNYVLYWTYIIVYKKIPLKDIESVDVRVDTVYSAKIGPAPATNLYFLNKSSKVIGKINTSVFSRCDLTALLNVLKATNPNLNLNNKAEALSGKDDSLITKDINQVYKSTFGSIGVMLVLALVVIGTVLLIK
jgi:hypothetical protein